MSHNPDKTHALQRIRHAASLDFDKCFMRRDKKGIYFDEFQAEFKAHEMRQLYMGTSRNSKKVELQNIGKGDKASYSRYQRFTEDYNKSNAHKTELYMVFSLTLLEDAWLKKEPGATFEEVKTWFTANRKVINEALEEGDESLAETEAKASVVVPGFSTKIEMLYKQMTDDAYQSKGQPTVFHFYDDSKRILDALHVFYSAHSALIPANITLKLHCVTDGVIEDYRPAEEAIFEIKSTRELNDLLDPDLSGECFRIGLKAAIKACGHENLIELDKDPDSADPADQQSMQHKTSHAFAQAVVKAERQFKHAATRRLVPVLGTAAGFAVFGAVSTMTVLRIMELSATGTLQAAVSNPVVIALAVVAILALAAGIISAVYLRRSNHVRKHSVLVTSSSPKQEGGVDSKADSVKPDGQ